MKKTIGNILLTIGAVGMLLYLMAHLTTTQQILVLLHFAFIGMLIYTVASGFGEVNKRIDWLAMQAPKNLDSQTKGNQTVGSEK